VDVLLAQVQLANDRQAQLVAQNALKQSLLTLARNMGMSPGILLDLAEPLHYQSLPQAQPDALLAAAIKARSDYLSLASQRQGLIEQPRANRARYYPKMSLSGNSANWGAVSAAFKRRA
jgi:outer membrane protein TolC